MVDRPDALNPGPRPWAVALVIASQAAALLWLLVAPLPSIESQRRAAEAGAGATVPPSLRRIQFLLTVDDHLGRLSASLDGGLGPLVQRLPIALAALLIAAAALGLGDLIIRGLGLPSHLPPLARWPLAFVSGATLLGSLTLAAGRLGLLDPWPTRVALMLIAASGAVVGIGTRRTAPLERPAIAWGTWPVLGLGLIVGPVLALMALGALQPTIEYDALEYHLRGPREYYENGRIAFLPQNVYTSMPSAVEMLHLLGMLVLGDWWTGALAGQLLVAAFAPAAAILVAAMALGWGSSRASWIAVLVYLTTPWIFRLGAFPFVEGPLCSYHAALALIAATAWRMPMDAAGHRRVRVLWGFAGLLAGGAIACKYPGLVSAVLPFGLLALVDGWRRRSGLIPVAFALGVAIGVGPWLLRNVLDTGNPIYPLGFDIFGGRDWDATLDARWWAAHGPRAASLEALGGALLDVAGRSDWQSPLYVLLVPLALVRRGSRPIAIALAFYVAYLFTTWFLLTHRLDRFWLPLLPAMAVLAGLGADWTSRRAWSAWRAFLLTVATAANLIFISTDLSGPTARLADLGRLRRETLAEVNPPLARLDEALPEGAKVLSVGQAGVFPVRHRVVTNTVFDRELIEEIASGRTPEEVRSTFDDRGITHVYVDWSEIARHRKPGGYGYSPFVTRSLFDDLVRDGVLGPPTMMGPDHWLYRVREVAR